MAYNVEYNCGVNGEESWNPVIDMNLSKTRAVARIFITEDQAKNFIDEESRGDNLDKYRIIEVE